MKERAHKKKSAGLRVRLAMSALVETGLKGAGAASTKEDRNYGETECYFRPVKAKGDIRNQRIVWRKSM